MVNQQAFLFPSLRTDLSRPFTFMRDLLRSAIALLLALPLFLSAAEITAQATATNTLIEQAQLKRLAQHPYWLQLLHYPRIKPNSNQQATSTIINPEFFIADDGDRNPVNELNATLNAFFTPPDDMPDNHAQCRFIARYRWLQQQLDWSQSYPPSVTCKQFNDWSMNGKIESISVVFVTGYLSNPASFYGHILLKANPIQSTIPVDLLAQTINYGAIVPENENPLIYIANGIFGGYNATFSHAKFYRYNHNYGEDELRDMWEYRLALSENEIEQLTAHAWELLGAQFTYYFAKENCAYRISELLELVINEPLYTPNTPWLLPATIFDRLAAIEKNGHPIIHSIKKTPSRQSRLHSGFLGLSQANRAIVESLVNDDNNLSAPIFTSLPETDKTEIIDTLIDYYEFRLLTENHDKKYQHKKNSVLIERSKLPAQLRSKQISEESNPPPHAGPLPSMIRTELLRNSERGSGIALEFRPAYYDMLMPDAGRIPNSKLTMLNLRTTYFDRKITIRSLDLVDIETLNLSQTGLPGDGGTSWRLKFGIDSQDLSCTDCLIFKIDSGIGKATALSKRSVVYGMVGGVLQSQNQNSGTLAATASISLLSNLTTYWRTQLLMSHKKYINHSQERYTTTHWENRLGINRQWDLRISYKKDIANELGVATSFYW